MTSRLLAALLGVTVAACARAQPPAAALPDAAVAVPKLVVMLTVDQLRPQYFTRYARQLTGGLARFYTTGAFYTNAFHDHAITETAPGHSVILSGRFPRSTGIYANALGVNTDSAPLIGSPSAGASPFRFRGTTLVDWLVAKDPRARVLSVSRKDRGAILPVGRSRQHVYWYGAPGIFTTSLYYMDTLPAWVSAFNARGIPRRAAGRAWELLLPASEYPERDSVWIENGGTKDIVFPHYAPPDSANAAVTFPNFPWMDDLTFDFALEGVRQLNLGAGPQTDVLAVSLSTMDAVGHRYGPDSREVHDMMLRLDRYMGTFIERLYSMRDSNSIVFVLTADHGVSPYPEVKSMYDPNEGAARVDPQHMISAARRAMAAARVDTTMLYWAEGMLYVDRRALASANVTPENMASAIASAVGKVPGILRADTRRMLARADTVRDAIARRWLHMVPDTYTADVFVTLRPFWEFSGGPPIAMHGSPHDYDAQVPVAFFGPWIIPGRNDQFTRVVDIAPTLAAIVGVTPSEPIDGRVLRSALRNPPPDLRIGKDAAPR